MDNLADFVDNPVDNAVNWGSDHPVENLGFPVDSLVEKVGVSVDEPVDEAVDNLVEEGSVAVVSALVVTRVEQAANSSA